MKKVFIILIAALAITLPGCKNGDKRVGNEPPEVVRAEPPEPPAKTGQAESAVTPEPPGVGLRSPNSVMSQNYLPKRVGGQAAENDLPDTETFHIELIW